MTLKLSENHSDKLKIQFIEESILMHNINRISVENEAIENMINVMNVDRSSCLALVETIEHLIDSEIELNNASNTVIVLWN